MIAIPIVAGLVVTWLALTTPDRGDVGIYREGARAAVTTGAVYGFEVNHGHGFTYPPFAALLMAGLAQLSTLQMWICLDVLSVVALATILALSAPAIVRAAGRGDPKASWRLAALLICEPVVTTFRIGQVDLILATLVLVDLLVLRRGFLLGLATAVKLTPGLFIVYLLVSRRYREAAAATATFAASVALGAVVIPHATWTYWSHNLLHGTGVGSVVTSGNQSIRGVVGRAFGAPVGVVVWALLAVPVAAFGVWLARRCARRGAELLAVAMVGITACVVSPVSWPHHWVWVVPALAVLWTEPTGRRIGRWLVAAAVVLDISTFVPIKAVGIGYLPIAVVLALAAWRAPDRGAGSPHVSGSESAAQP